MTTMALRARATRGLLVVAVAGLAVACGSGVQERGASPTTTASDGRDTVLVPPPSSVDVEIPAGQDPSALLGDDPELDELARACFGDDLFACDTLFLRTEAGSDLEAYSQTCGGRIPPQDGAPDCADRFHATASAPRAPGDLGGNGDLDALAEECFQGQFSSCDDLFLQSPVGSEYEAYGGTCAGRLALPTDGGCEAQFG